MRVLLLGVNRYVVMYFLNKKLSTIFVIPY